MNALESFFYNQPHRYIAKWKHYFNIYERHFAAYVNKAPVILEIGIYRGGSLQMWKHYFGEGTRIVGIDIDPACKDYEEEGIEIFIGSQDDPVFLKTVLQKYPQFDIIIDDGGHFADQQCKSFLYLFDHLKFGGVYLCEDLHTSYWSDFNGGYRNPGSFIEFSKTIIDSVNAWYSEDERLSIDGYTTTVRGIHFYDSIVVVDKEPIERPSDLRKDNDGFEERIYQQRGKKKHQEKGLLRLIYDYLKK